MALTRPRYSNFVDNDFKNSCRVVTTTNITLTSGAPSTYDGVALAVSDRILVAGQNTSSQNGIYIVGTLGTGSNGTWIRSFDANDGTKLSAGAQVPIGEGSYSGRTWRLTTPDPITVGATNLTFLDGAAIAGGSNTQLQFNNSGSLQGISTLTYVSGNTSVVSTGNVFAATLYTDNLRWASNSASIVLTGNINPAVYIGNTLVGTTTVLIDSVPASGNAMVSWTTISRDTVNSRYKKSTIDSFNDGSTVTFAESSIKSNPAYNVAVFTSNIAGGLIKLWATGDSASTVITFERRVLGSTTPVGYINNFGPIGPAGTIELTSSNIVTTATSAATSTTTGALQISGGAGIAGNLYTGGSIVAGLDLTVLGNLTVLGTTTTLNTNTLDVEDLNITVAKGAASAAAADGAGITVDGAGASFNYTAATDAWTSNKKIYATTLYTGGDLKWSSNGATFRSGINYTTSDVAPINANYGDQWYDTATDILYEWQTANGTNGFWVDIGSLAIIANANLSNQVFNTVSANNVTSAANITAGNVVLGGIGSGWIYANNFVFSQNGASIFDSFGVNSYGNVNVATYLPTYTGNIQGANVYVVGNDSISTTTGALRVVGGVGITGNIYTNGNLAVGAAANYYNSAGAGKGLDIVATTASKVGYLNLVGGSGSSGLLTFGNTAGIQAVITTGTDNSLTFATKSPTTGANVASAALTLYSDQTARVSGNLTVGQSNGNILVTNGYISGTYTPTTAIGAAVQLTGKDTQGGTGYFDFLKATNVTSGATNPNKTIRLTSAGTIEVINSAYSATLMSLSDQGFMSVSGAYQVSGKQAVNGPAFRAYVDTGQTITSGSQQKVTFGTENFDTAGCFASSTFTPTLEGYYQLNAVVRISGGSSTGEIMLVLYKNGAEYARGTNESGTEQGASFYSMSISDIAYANGTGDNFDVRIQQTSGGDRVTTAGSSISHFSGCMIRGA